MDADEELFPLLSLCARGRLTVYVHEHPQPKISWISSICHLKSPSNPGKPKEMPLLVSLSLLPACTLAISFFTTASAFSLANRTNPLNPSTLSCYPASGSAIMSPLTERDCLQALGEFQRNLPFVITPILTHDPDKAHLPAYILAPATATWGECIFRANIPPGNDARIDVQALEYEAIVLLAKCVARPDYDGGQCSVEAEGAKIWIRIDFQHSMIPLMNATRVGVGNDTNAAELVLNSSTVETVLSLPVMSGNAEAAISK